jgi:hypothetical protein
MDFQLSEPGNHDCEACPDYAPGGAAEVMSAGLPRGVREALADPIVQALMIADRVDPQRVEELVQRMAALLASNNGGPAPSRMRGRG